jgi:hypothetical protein
MLNSSFRVLAALAALVLGIVATASSALGQASPGWTMVPTAQGPMLVQLKWSESDLQRQRSRLAEQSRKRLRAPAPPSDVAATDTGSASARVSWTDNSDAETGFEIERSPAFPAPVSVGANVTEYIDPCGPGQFSYRVRAVNPAGWSSYTPWQTVVIADVPPVPPSGLTVANSGDGTAVLEWQDNSTNEVRFEIQRAPAFSTGISVGSNVTTYSDPAGPGTFSYRVRAVNVSGASVFTPWVQVTITVPLPAAPSNLAAQDLGTGSARLTWTDNSNNETGFQIQRNPSFSSGLILISANATSYVDPSGAGLYAYRVRAVNSAGGSDFTPWATVSIAEPIPAAPTNVQATDTGTRRALVTWTDNSGNETGFEIQRNPVWTSGSTIQVGANVTGYMDLCGPGTFAYRVRSFNAVGASAYSAWASVNVAEIPPSAPTGLSLLDLGNQRDVQVNWTDTSTNETGFKIERQTQTGASTWGTTQPFSVSANITQYSDNPGIGTHRYRVAATNSAGDSPWTPWVTIIVADGWSLFTPSADSRIIYVSSSTGNDSNNGLSEAFPKKTIAAGKTLLRNGYPDWLLLKRGDVWNEGLGSIDVSGRSPTERMVFGSYGTSTVRPELRTGTANGITKNCGGNGLTTRDYLAFVGLRFVANGFTGSEGSMGICWVGSGTYVLFEDLYVEGYATNVVLEGYITQTDGIAIRRCVFVDAYSTNSHSQGLYAYKANNLLIEECVFDHNGFKEGVQAADIYNHNVYIQNGSTGLVFRRNIVMDASSHGIQARPGGTVEGNFFARNAIQAMLGGGMDPDPAGSTGSFVRNVVIEAKDITPSIPRGYGLDLMNLRSALVEDNVFAHQIATAAAFPIGSWVGGGPVGIGLTNVTIRNNIVYDWNGSVQFNNPSPGTYSNNIFENNKIQQTVAVSSVPVARLYAANPAQILFRNNRYQSPLTASSWFVIGSTSMNFASWVAATQETGATTGATSYPAPNRTTSTYAASQGLPATFDAFRAEVRKMSRFNWRPEWTAAEINKYVRSGFGLPD